MLATSYEDGKIKKGQRVRSITRTSHSLIYNEGEWLEGGVI